MKPILHLVIVVFMCAAFSTAVFASRFPRWNGARKHLEKAHELITKRTEGAAVKKNKDEIPQLLSLLIDAEEELHESKNNKGSNTPATLKLIDEAKTELEAAKDGEEGDHINNADLLIQDALKHVQQALNMRPAKS